MHSDTLAVARAHDKPHPHRRFRAGPIHGRAQSEHRQSRRRTPDRGEVRHPPKVAAQAVTPCAANRLASDEAKNIYSRGNDQLQKKPTFIAKKRNSVSNWEESSQNNGCTQVDRADCGAQRLCPAHVGRAGAKQGQAGVIVMSRKLTPRQVIARSYPTWDYAMADRMIAWLAECGYEITAKEAVEPHQMLASPASADQDAAELANAC